MVDITLCTGENCTKKMSCHRYLCKSDSDWQSMMMPLPQGKDSKGHPLPINGCDVYWPINKNDIGET